MENSLSPEKLINIILVDDHNVFRKSFGALLEEISDVNIYLEARDGLELLELLEKTNVISFDIILLDIEMPRMNGSETLKQLSRLYPEIKVIMLSTHFSNSLALEYFEMGARAFLPKNAEIEDVLQTIYCVHKTGFSIKLSQEITKELTDQNISYLAAEYDLNVRELNVIYWTCMGKANKEISGILGIAERTVEHYRTQIYQKTKTHSIADIVMFGVKNGIV